MKHFTLKYFESDKEQGYFSPSVFLTKTKFTFDDDAKWDSVLYQFCKYLEAIGYEGVMKNVYVDINSWPHFKHPSQYVLDDTRKE